MMNIRDIESRPLDTTTKGLPGPVTPASVAAKSWNLLRDDLPLPSMVLLESALSHNLTTMAEWCRKNGFLLAPHGKTTMCPQIYKRQFDLGAWGMTVASASQALVCEKFQVPRILIANQLVGKGNVHAMAGALSRNPELEIYCLVDSVDGVDHLATHLRDAQSPRPVRVLLESGRKGWRTGVRTIDEGRQVLSAIRRHAGAVEFAGFEGFEGIARLEEGAEVQSFLGDLLKLADGTAGDLPAPAGGFLLSIGGSAYLDYIQEFLAPLKGRFRTVVRSGCTVTTDHGVYARQVQRARGRGKGQDLYPDFRPALELWSYVQSVRDGDTAILTFGKRDCSFDSDLPLPLFSVKPGAGRKDARPLPGAKVVKLNDQHAYMTIPAGVEVRVGDRVACGISHPCLAIDKWAVIPVVDDDYKVLDLYCTYF
jgi:D-serine dehydratase